MNTVIKYRHVFGITQNGRVLNWGAFPYNGLENPAHILKIEAQSL